MLAEFLVARAVGDRHEPRIGWDNLDARAPDGTTIEVKCSAFLQSWTHKRHSEPQGLLQRLELIDREFPGTSSGLRWHKLAESVPLADCSTAYAALWTALRVACGVVDPERDALGRDANGRSPRADGLLLRIVA